MYACELLSIVSVIFFPDIDARLDSFTTSFQGILLGSVTTPFSVAPVIDLEIEILLLISLSYISVFSSFFFPSTVTLAVFFLLSTDTVPFAGILL